LNVIGAVHITEQGLKNEFTEQGLKNEFTESDTYILKAPTLDTIISENI
jgi:hypothetical protein